MTIWEGIKDSFRKGTTLTQLIYINVGVWLTVNIAYIILFLFSVPAPSARILEWLAVPAYLPSLLTHPWTVITYMFTHQNFFHILFNMLWLYWFGLIFLQYFDPRKLVGVYLLGGLSGAFLYILTFNIFPAFHPILHRSIALGASASIMAVVIAISVYVPNYTVRITLIGPVKIKYIALIAFILTTLVDFSSNTGGKIAHLGGALYGYLFIVQYRKGKDNTKSINRFLDAVFSWFRPHRKKLHVTHKRPVDDMEYNRQKADEQKKIDRILDKISKGGYDSLTKEEKETLFKMSKKH